MNKLSATGSGTTEPVSLIGFKGGTGAADETETLEAKLNWTASFDFAERVVK